MISGAKKGRPYVLYFKKRLFCSNILMIVVPAVIVAFVGLLCMALLWMTLRAAEVCAWRMEKTSDISAGA